MDYYQIWKILIKISVEPRIIAAADFLMSSWPSFDFPSARPRRAERIAAKMLIQIASGLETEVELAELD